MDPSIPNARSAEINQASTSRSRRTEAKKKKLTPRQKKLAAMTPPRNKITRGDVITAAKKKAKKK